MNIGKQRICIALVALVVAVIALCGVQNQAHASVLNDIAHQLTGNHQPAINNHSYQPQAASKHISNANYLTGNKVPITKAGSGKISITLKGKLGSARLDTTFGSKSKSKSKKATINANNIKLLTTRYTYNGRAKKPAVRIKDNQGKELKPVRDFTLSYTGNTKPGTAKVKITMKGNYTGSFTKTIRIDKAKNPMTTPDLSVVDLTIANVRNKNKTIAKSTAFPVNNAKGKVTFKKISGPNAISVNSAGKVTVKKGTYRGKYTIRVAVTAAGNSLYQKGTKNMNLTVYIR